MSNCMVAVCSAFGRLGTDSKLCGIWADTCSCGATWNGCSCGSIWNSCICGIIWTGVGIEDCLRMFIAGQTSIRVPSTDVWRSYMAACLGMTVGVHSVFLMSKTVPSTGNTSPYTVYSPVGSIPYKIMFRSSTIFPKIRSDGWGSYSRESHTAENLFVACKGNILGVIMCSARRYTKGGRYSDTAIILE